MTGALLVVKPPGMTSHDVVQFVRRCTGAKTGHTGTLDPAAAGLLVVCSGRATRLARYLVGCDKTYRVEITFGLSTETGDAEGQVSARGVTDHLSAEAVGEALAGLTGELSLPVPRYSAVKRKGQPLHRQARRGQREEPPQRLMRVDRWELLEFRPGPTPVARTELDCATGTYVRSLVPALAEVLDTEAYLSFLVRTRVGSFLLEQAYTLEELALASQSGTLAERLIQPAQALGHLPAVEVSDQASRLLSHGRAVAAPDGALSQPGCEQVCVLDARGQLVCVARVIEEADTCQLQPETVLAPASIQE